MTSQRGYEYLDEKPVDPDLMCLICHKPFVNPKSLPCNHVFCNSCLIQNNSINDVTCPLCKTSLPRTALEDVNRPLLNMLQRLRVKCTGCGQIGLERGSFDQHVETVCSKASVNCSSVDVDCPWTGLREHLDGHLATCAYKIVRPKLTQLIAANRQLTDKIDEQNAQVNELHKEIEKYKTDFNNLELKNREYKTSISNMHDEIRDLRKKLLQTPGKWIKGSSLCAKVSTYISTLVLFEQRVLEDERGNICNCRTPFEPIFCRYVGSNRIPIRSLFCGAMTVLLNFLN